MGIIQACRQVVQGKFDAFRGRAFVGAVGALIGGTALAQALTVLVLPLLTRIYTPEDFSLFAVFVSMSSLISVAACLRLEIAIPLPEEDTDAANLLVLALCCSTLINSLISLTIIFLAVPVLRMLGASLLLPYIWLLPFGVWLGTMSTALQYWAIRKTRFATVAKTRVTQAIGGASAQVGLGIAGFTPGGLLVGQILSGSVGIFRLGREIAKCDLGAVRMVRWPSLKRVLQEYSRFPKYSAIESLISTAGIQIPIILISGMSFGPEAGFLMLGLRVMQAPMALIGGAVAQVYLSRAPQEHRDGTLGSFTAAILAGLVKTGAGPIVFIGILAPSLANFFLGEEWRRTGELIVWMTPWFLFQFLSSPVSMVMHIKSGQRTLLLLAVGGLVMRVGAILCASQFQAGMLSEFYAAGSALFYAMLAAVVYRQAEVTRSLFAPVFVVGMQVVLLWALIGVLGKYLFKVFGYE